MIHHRLTRTATIAMAIAAFAAPSAVAQTDVSPSTPAVAGQMQQHLRSPDAIDAATPAPTTTPLDDKRSPDARDAGEGREPSNSPEVVVVKLTDVAPAPSGFDWADAAIGAGALLGLILLTVGGALVVVHRRHAATSRMSEGILGKRSSGRVRAPGRWARRAAGPAPTQTDDREVTSPRVATATTERGRRRQSR